MAIKPVNRESITLLQEAYRKFWTKFNYVSSCNEVLLKILRFIKSYRLDVIRITPLGNVIKSA